jgi:hypothetical protein
MSETGQWLIILEEEEEEEEEELRLANQTSTSVASPLYSTFDFSS